MIILAKASVFDRMSMAIGLVSGVWLTLGGGWSTVWGNLDLVRRVTAL